MKQKPQPLNLEEMNKLADEIMEMFCVVDDRPYPEGTGIWGMDTELFSTDENETARSKARKKIITKLKQRLKSACEFYLRYKDKPELLVKECPKLLNISPKISELIFDLDSLLIKYSVNTNFIGRKLVESLGIEANIDKLAKTINKKISELFKLIKEEIHVDFTDIDKYNEWLFKLSFKDILEKGK